MKLFVTQGSSGEQKRRRVFTTDPAEISQLARFVPGAPSDGLGTSIRLPHSDMRFDSKFKGAATLELITILFGTQQLIHELNKVLVTIEKNQLPQKRAILPN